MIDELERLEKAACPGPWTAFDIDSPDYWPRLFREVDTRLIYAARNALPGLLAEVRAAREWLRLQPTTNLGIFYEEATEAREAYHTIVEKNS